MRSINCFDNILTSRFFCLSFEYIRKKWLLYLIWLFSCFSFIYFLRKVCTFPSLEWRNEYTDLKYSNLDSKTTKDFSQSFPCCRHFQRKFNKMQKNSVGISMQHVWIFHVFLKKNFCMHSYVLAFCTFCLHVSLGFSGEQNEPNSHSSSPALKIKQCTINWHTKM